MATTDGGVLKVTGQSGAWYWAGHGEIRFIPAGNGLGTWLQTIGWPLITTNQTTIDELVENFGQGADFT